MRKHRTQGSLICADTFVGVKAAGGFCRTCSVPGEPLCDAAKVAAGVILVVALGFLTGPVDLFDNPAFAVA